MSHDADAIPRLSDLETSFSGRTELRTCHNGIPLLPGKFQPFRSIATPLTYPEQPEIPPPPFATILLSRDRDFADYGDILKQIDKRCSEPAA
ncbi:hypothetical protein B0H67DRAFT_296376 [Lasiosphaeris hirsuta]|uniref:Uncharacterized protein n=1 Tax=Lasiosphaeris hirsuta TaxID=260670 RepID=A0AA40DSE8_9PEZI|nr:hypothetical protein B0H67DRAFT_296376 [Lasiosphaeris hirsuta]